MAKFLIASAEDDDLDLLLLDLHMPGSGDLYGLIRVRDTYPLLPIAIISGSEDPAVVAKCIGFGALGFIPKSLSSAHIAEAIDVIMQGDIWVPEAVQLQFVTTSAQRLYNSSKNSGTFFFVRFFAAYKNIITLLKRGSVHEIGPNPTGKRAT